MRRFFHKLHRVRWVYLSLIPAILLVVWMVFDHHFFEHLLYVMGIEALLHHFAAYAIADEASNVVSEAVSEAVEVAEDMV
jgi:hypothetical protein